MPRAYKILLVEDRVNESSATYEGLFRKWLPKGGNITKDDDNQGDENTLFEQSGLLGGSSIPQTTNRANIFERLTSLSFVDIAENLENAFEYLKENAEQYALILLDLDLGKLEPTETLKKVWPDCDWGGVQQRKQEEQGGSLIFEYLCIEKGIAGQAEGRVRFFTQNADQATFLKDFLKGMHIAPAKLIVNKAEKDSQEYTKLQAMIDDPVSFRIQAEHPEVFLALGAKENPLEIAQDEHAENLIQAIAYAEGIKLEGLEKPERPSIALLRALGEAATKEFNASLRRATASFNDTSTNSGSSYDQNKKIKSSILTYNNDCSFWDMALYAYSAQFRHIDIDRIKLDFALDTQKIISGDYIFKKFGSEALQKIRQHGKRYAHINQFLNIIQTLGSQEIHHNEREWCVRNRLHLMVYAVCELLSFYHEKLMGNSIVLNDKKITQSHILDVIQFANKNDSGWVSLSILDDPVFSEKLDSAPSPKRSRNFANELKSLGFEIDATATQFRFQEY